MPCVYCGSEALSIEHVIPRAFGQFFDHSGCEVVLKDRVCQKCNNSFSSFERSHAQMSVEAFTRAHAGVKGRQPKKPKPNPYVKDKTGRTPIVLTGKRPGSDREILYRMDPKEGLVERTSAQFKHPKTGQVTAVDLTPEMTRAEMVAKLNEAGYANGIELAVYWRDGEQSWVTALFNRDNIQINEPPPPHMVQTKIEGGLRIEDFRSIAKIAFNYFMKFNPVGLVGSETYFEACRAFIRNGTADPLSICAISDPHFAPAGIDRPSHRLRLKIDRGIGIIVYIQLFVSTTSARSIHRVMLSKYPVALELPPVDLSHRFEISGDDDDRGILIAERP